MSVRVAKTLQLWSSAVVVFALLYSGILHATQPYAFVFSAAQYEILPLSIVGPVMLLLPYVQIALAICMITGVAERFVLCSAEMLFVAFAVAQSIVIFRGTETSCGCFGLQSEPVGPRTLAVPIVCGCLCLAIAWFQHRATPGQPFR